MSREFDFCMFPSGSDAQVIGMTARDYFAAQAMVALMSSPAWVKGMDKQAAKQGMEFKPFLALSCYAMADAMLKARIQPCA